MSNTTDEVIRKTVAVPLPLKQAFTLFTDGLGTWWPLDQYHIGGDTPQTAVIEPNVGGRWFERAADGTECDWGRVLAWDPPSRLVLTWEISADWRADPGIKTEVEVRFVEEAPDRTRVELEHSGLASYGDRAAEMTAIFSSEGGWAGVLGSFRAAAQR